jgi:hypothetical protein
MKNQQILEEEVRIHSAINDGNLKKYLELIMEERQKKKW